MTKKLPQQQVTLTGVLLLIAATSAASAQVFSSWSYNYPPRVTSSYSSSGYSSGSRPLLTRDYYSYNHPAPFSPFFGAPFPFGGPLLAHHQPAFLFRPQFAPVRPQYVPVRPLSSSSASSLSSSSSSSSSVESSFPSESSESSISSAPLNTVVVTDSAVSATNSFSRPSSSRPVVSPANVRRPVYSVVRRPVTPGVSRFVSRPVVAAPATSEVVMVASTPAPAPLPSTANDADIGFEAPSNSDSSSLAGPTVSDPNSPPRSPPVRVAEDLKPLPSNDGFASSR